MTLVERTLVKKKIWIQMWRLLGLLRDFHSCLNCIVRVTIRKKWRSSIQNPYNRTLNNQVPTVI